MAFLEENPTATHYNRDKRKGTQLQRTVVQDIQLWLFVENTLYYTNIYPEKHYVTAVNGMATFAVPCYPSQE